MKLFFFAVTILLLAQPSAFAALGGDRKNIDSERDGFHTASELQTTEAAGYTAIVVQTPTAKVTQYANSKGQIFAVKWRGINPPDLTILLGEHYAEYKAARANMKKTPGRRPLMVKSENIVVRHSGHMRDNRGLAYKPSLVPTGVTPENLP